MKCKHRNFDLIEHVSTYTRFEFRDGQVPENGIGWHGDNDPTGGITVSCLDCDHEQTYKMYRTWPKWVKKAWEDLMAEQQKDLAKQ